MGEGGGWLVVGRRRGTRGQGKSGEMRDETRPLEASQREPPRRPLPLPSPVSPLVAMGFYVSLPLGLSWHGQTRRARLPPSCAMGL